MAKKKAPRTTVVPVKPHLEAGAMSRPAPTKMAVRVLSLDSIDTAGRIRKHLGDLSSLVESIRDRGLLQPVVVTQEGKLVAGARRVAAVKKLGRIEIPAHVLAPGDDALSLLLKERDENTERIPFAVTESLKLAERLEKIERDRAKAAQIEGQREGGKTSGRGRQKLGEKFAQSKPADRKAMARVAAAVGMSRPTLEKAQEVAAAAKAEPEKFAALVEEMDRTGKVDGAHKQLRRAKSRETMRTTNLAAEAKGKYSVILADPPWQYGNTGLAGAAEDQYPTMSTDKLCALPVADLATPNAVLFLWVTNPLLPDGLRVAEAWGFEYRTKFVWVKNRGTPAGFYVRSRTEDLWICTRGKGLTIDPDKLPDNVIEEAVRKHSQKPERSYGVIEKMYPDAKRLEMFCRSPRDGWTAWGNQV